MRKSIIALAVAGSVAVGGAALATPALAGTTAPASASAESPTTDRPSPQARITGALEGLVTDGTITRAQSEKIATTLAGQLPEGGPGGHHGGMRGGGAQIEAAVAEALGISEADLRTEQQAGRSIADVAQEKGVDLATVTTAVTDAAQARIAQGVEDGSISQARADALTANLGARIAEEIDEVHDGSHRGGPGGPRDGWEGSGPAAPPSQAAPTS